MKISSKSSSHLIPLRSTGREAPQISLATSRSRRLRTSGSVNGGKASPMFRVVENPEPTSPKVTCIGQVRVRKSKRNGRKMRSKSRRRSTEVFVNPQFQKSQREYLSDQNAKWVHLPLTICEALRGLGADLNCFSSEREKIDQGKPGRSSSCGALMVELVVEGRGERISTQRRHFLEGIEFKDEEHTDFEICVPPKNALLLMRCRSDPVKMAALAKRLLETSATEIIEEEEKEEKGEENMLKIPPEKQEKDIKEDENGGENGGKCLEIDNELQQSDKKEEEDEEKLEEKENSGHGIEAENEDGVAERCGEEEEEETQNDKSKEREREKPKLERESSVLPDCLLLMMYEPKLSMEVSKETWVCSTDFIRWQPATEKKKVSKIKDRNYSPVRTEPPQQSPHPFPDGESIVSMIEQKLVSFKAREPVVLTRCQSEPRRSAAKLTPDAFFWKHRRVEPYCSARLGLNTAWVGL